MRPGNCLAFFCVTGSMIMRSVFMVFIAGWVAWFWIDKPPGGQYHMPYAGDNLIDNFQHAFNLLKAGSPEMAFTYIWGAHYIILSILGGMLVAVTYGSISDYLGRRRMRRHFMPPASIARKQSNGENPPGQ